MRPTYFSAEQFLNERRPIDPVRCFRPHAVIRAVNWFQSQFVGGLIYAVKANMAPDIVRTVAECGVQNFDVASLTEVDLIYHGVPGATLFYMNPVKSRAHIRSAYFDYGVRCFALDHREELEKIMTVTEEAKDLTLFVRLHCDDTGSVLPLGKKYGAESSEAIELLKAVRQKAERLGVTFHVGSQALQAERYGEAIRYAGDLLKRAGVVAELLNVGGGFPVFYKEGDPIDLSHYVSEIETSLDALPMVQGGEVFAEPGRALVAESESLIVRVDARRDQELFINDGGYGVLFDAANCDWVFPLRLIGHDDICHQSSHALVNKDLVGFEFWGPTCDAADHMKGPFYLPHSVKEGDYLEIHKTGAYGGVMASGFNGFGCYEEIILKDDVMGSNFTPIASQTSDHMLKLIS